MERKQIYKLSENTGGGVQHCSDIQSRYPLQSNLKIDVIGLMVEDYFSENNNNKEQD